MILPVRDSVRVIKLDTETIPTPIKVPDSEPHIEPSPDDPAPSHTPPEPDPTRTCPPTPPPGGVPTCSRKV